MVLKKKKKKKIPPPPRAGSGLRIGQTYPLRDVQAV